MTWKTMWTRYAHPFISHAPRYAVTRSSPPKARPVKTPRTKVRSPDPALQIVPTTGAGAAPGAQPRVAAPQQGAAGV